MFYETEKNNHGLPHDPFKGCVIPRPIGWITSINQQGIVNLAPFSFFNAVSDNPHMVMFSSAGRGERNKSDTLTNIELTKEFVVNLATFDLKNEMNLSSTPLPYGASETETFQIATTPSMLVKPPRVKEACVHLECQYVKTVKLDFGEQTNRYTMAVGHVVGIHINDDLIVNGKVEVGNRQVIARMGYDEYALVDNIFQLNRPP